MKKKLFTLLTAAATAVCTLSVAALTAFADGEEAAAETTSATQTTSMGAGIVGSLIIPLAIMFALLYFIAIKPQKKQEKELKAMQASLQVGDEIVTGGGIVGIVVSVGDDTVVIETGGAKHKLRIKNWAITENVTASERMKAQKAASGKKTEAGLTSAAVVDDDEDEAPKKKKSKKDKSDK